MKIFHGKLRHYRNTLLSCSALLILSASAHAVVFQAENYNAYSDTTPGNTGGVYRSDSVDIEATQDTGGGYDVGWIAASEWLTYNNLVIPSTGSYTIKMRVASPSGATASVDLNGGSIQLGNFAIPATGGWQTWTTVTRTVTLNAGTYNLGVFAQTAGWNFNWIEVAANGTATKSLVWSDEFDSINAANWTNDTGGGGYGNNEREFYTAGQNLSIQYDAQAGSNVAVFEARRENPANYNCWYGRCEYTSARMSSSGKKTFKYGRIEARMKLPQTAGIWPAFWMLGSNIGSVGWPTCGEIDIMEHIGSEAATVHGSMHGPNYFGNTPFTGPYYFSEAINANYHVFAVEWDTNSVSYFVDNTKYYTVTKTQVQTYGNWVFDQPMFILFNLAVGGTWPGNPDGTSTFPQRMLIDYVRVYQ
jgi:beta-glucanase (GH16 family)